jgi:hypothetical protein
MWPYAISGRRFQKAKLLRKILVIFVRELLSA